MRSRWDWLLPALTVPFVPTLGPVHPDALDAALFEAVVDVAGSGNFLPYDKDRRRSDTKTETILAANMPTALSERSFRPFAPAMLAS